MNDFIQVTLMTFDLAEVKMKCVLWLSEAILLIWISGFIDENCFVPVDFALISLSDSSEREIEQTLKSKHSFHSSVARLVMPLGAIEKESWCNFSSEWIKALFFLSPNKHQTQ